VSLFICLSISVITEIPDNKVIERLRGCVFYDGHCAVCMRLAEQSRRLLRRQRIDLAPLQTGGLAPRLGVPTDNLLKEMRFLTKAGGVFGGAEAVVQIARRTWWGWPLFALSRVPGVMRALRCLYRWIAGRRNCGDGVCDGKQPYRAVAWLPSVGLLVIALGLKSLLIV
jgi:predicted DCC family thiol-disulfide oxidoreductase YuxK